MRTARTVTTIPSLLLLGGIFVFAAAALAENKKPSFGTRPGPAATQTRLEVKEFSGEFEQWRKERVINEPETITFRYATDQPGAATAYWQVWDRAPNFADPLRIRLLAPQMLAGGNLGAAPAQGHLRWFNVNFAAFAPPQPPASPADYYLVVGVRDSAGKTLGVPSAAVRVRYQKSNQPPTDFSSIPVEKPVPMPVAVSLSRFEVHRTNEGEGDDDPYLFAAVVYADGTTVKVGDLANSSVRIDSPSQTHNNLGMDAYSDEPRSGRSYLIPASTGQFSRGIFPLWGLPVQQSRSLSTVAVVVIAMDEDNTSTAAANAARNAFVNNLRSELNAAIRSGTAPDMAAIQQTIQATMIEAAKKETLSNWWKPWFLLSLPDQDDYIGAGVATFSYAQIHQAGTAGLPITLRCGDGDGDYSIHGRIRRTN